MHKAIGITYVLIIWSSPFQKEIMLTMIMVLIRNYNLIYLFNTEDMNLCEFMLQLQRRAHLYERFSMENTWKAKKKNCNTIKLMFGVADFLREKAEK